MHRSAKRAQVDLIEEANTHFPLFVYGTLKRGFRLHRYLEGAKFVRECYVKGLLVDLGPFPGIFLKNDGIRVKGELYEISRHTLRLLDEVEGHGTLFGRTITTCFHEEKDKLIGTPVWVYEYLNIHNAKFNAIPSGEWTKNPLMKEI